MRNVVLVLLMAISWTPLLAYLQVAPPQPCPGTTPAWNVSPNAVVLYLNCENHLTAPAAPRGKALPIRFSATGATIKVDAKAQQLLIVPSAKVVTLWARRGKALVFRHRFRAVLLPLPIMEFFGGSRPANDGEANRREDPTSWPLPPLSLKAIPAECLSMIVPNDARYRADGFQIAQLRNGLPVAPAILIEGRIMQEFNEWTKALQPGDLIRIDISTVERMNFRGEVEKVPFNKQFTFLFSDKCEMTKIPRSYPDSVSK